MKTVVFLLFDLQTICCLKGCANNYNIKIKQTDFYSKKSEIYNYTKG